MKQLVDMIEYRANRKNYTPEQLAIIMRVNVSTFYNRKNKPAYFRLSELQNLAKKSDMDITISADGKVSATGKL